MLLKVRANGQWIRMECADAEEAIFLMLCLHKGGTYIDEWHCSNHTDMMHA